MMECLEKDWKFFRSKISQWQENYMARLSKEYVELLCSDKDASAKFWELEKRINRDKKHPGVIIQMRRSTMFYDIVTLVRDGVIGFEDLEGFSDEFKERVEFFLGR